MAFGYVHDADFGPLVMVSAGGTLLEYFADRQCPLMKAAIIGRAILSF
ncbi:acetate--CoA ligase family protein [Mesorhizobium sp. M1312]